MESYSSKMNKFRPQDIDKKFLIQERRRTGRVENYNWQSRVRWYRAKDGINRQFIIRAFQYLHYCACHAPTPVQKKWKHAYRQFENRHFARKGQASVRFLNTWTCHAWL